MASKVIMGIDCSSKSLAFSLFKGKKLVRYGEIFFDDMNVHQRVGSASRQMQAMASVFGRVDEIYYESAVYIQNKQTVITLAMALGAALGPIINDNTKVFPTPPIVWQRYMNPSISKAEKAEMKKGFADKSDSWIKEHYRKEHKRRGIVAVNTLYGVTVTSDNVSDAILVGGYGTTQ